MSLKSVSGITCHVKNVSKSAKFYETLGFKFRTREPDHATAYLNWFWIDLLSIDKETRPGPRKSAKLATKGAGILIYISVEDVDRFHKTLVSRRLKPSTEPQDSPWGNREFMIKDPDGYQLVFFKRK